MPLGKLSMNSIEEGFRLLAELERYITKHGEVVDQTIRFYTHQFYAKIPHTVGNNNLPLLNTMDMIRVSIFDIWDVKIIFRFNMW